MACSIFLSSFMAASVSLRRRAACAVCTGCSVISVQRWFDRVIHQSSAGLRNVIHVLSARIFVHATRWSMFLVVSVVELTFGAPTSPEPTHCTAHVTFCTGRQV